MTYSHVRLTQYNEGTNTKPRLTWVVELDDFGEWNAIKAENADFGYPSMSLALSKVIEGWEVVSMVADDFPPAQYGKIRLTGQRFVYLLKRKE